MRFGCLNTGKQPAARSRRLCSQCEAVSVSLSSDGNQHIEFFFRSHCRASSLPPAAAASAPDARPFQFLFPPMEINTSSFLRSHCRASSLPPAAVGTRLLPLPRGIVVFLTAIPASHGGQVRVQARASSPSPAAAAVTTRLLPLPRGIFVFLTAIPTSHGGQVCVQAPCFKVDRVATGTDST